MGSQVTLAHIWCLIKHAEGKREVRLWLGGAEIYGSFHQVEANLEGMTYAPCKK